MASQRLFGCKRVAVVLLLAITVIHWNMGAELIEMKFRSLSPSNHRSMTLCPNEAMVTEKLEKIRMSELLDFCHTGQDLMITRFGVFSGLRNQLATVFTQTCYPLEILTSQGARSMGHCSDFVPYVAFANARLSPPFDDDVLAKHLAYCNNTATYLHGEYPNTFLFKHAKYNYWMPNIEHLKVEQAHLVPLTFEFLAKVKVGAYALQKLVDSYNLTDRNIGIRYMVHSSPEATLNLMGISPNYNRFYHGYGHSGLKHTIELVECWASRPDFPILTVVGNKPLTDFKSFKSNDSSKHPKNMRIISERLSIHQIRFLQATHGVHVTPSQREGFGHYINEGRASAALIVATNHAPMNEFVEDGNSGVLIDHGATPKHLDWQLLGVKGIFDPNVYVSPASICKAIESVLAMPLSKRKFLGRNSRKNFVRDAQMFRSNLIELNRILVVRCFGNTKSWEEAIEELAGKANKLYLAAQDMIFATK